MKIFCTQSSKQLSQKISGLLRIDLADTAVQCFANSEFVINASECSSEAIVIASTKTSDDWIELFLMLDMLRAAKSLILCLPYMGYLRQSNVLQNQSRGAQMFFHILETMRVDSCLLLDAHIDPISRIVTDNLSALKLFQADIELNITPKYASSDIVVVSPDFGGVKRAETLANLLKSEFALCKKTRDVFGNVKKIELLGDVKNKICILVDDIIDSGSTLCHASDILLQSGCREVMAYCTHAVLSDGAFKKVSDSGICEVVITDSIFYDGPLPDGFRLLSVDGLLADVIRNYYM